MRINFKRIYQVNTWLKLGVVGALLTTSCSVENEKFDNDIISGREISGLSSESVEIPINGIISDTEQHKDSYIELAIDDDEDSKWLAFGNEINVDLDLNYIQKVDFVKISFYEGDDKSFEFEVFALVNGSYVSLGSNASVGTNTNLEIYDLIDIETHSLRIQFRGNDVDLSNGVNDIEVWGTLLNREVVEPGAQHALITDTSDLDTGELRLDLSESIAKGMMSVTVNKEITQDGFINLSGTSASRVNALIDMRLDDRDGYSFTESGSSVNAIANFPTLINNEFIEVVITWDATAATATEGPLVSVSIDGQTVTDTAFVSESRNLVSVQTGVKTIQFRLGSNGAFDATGAGMLVDNLKVYNTLSGTPELVFEDDFESYVVGNSLDPNAATASVGAIADAISEAGSPYRSNSFQVTVGGEAGTDTPDLDPDPSEPGEEIPDSLKTSPFIFSDLFVGDAFQVDNDGEGAHNWSARKYDVEPIDNGFDIRDFIFVTDNRLILQCPNSEHNESSNLSRRRAEYRDQENINLDDAHGMDFVFDIRNYDNSSELIMAQLHNDNSAARRPYITVLAEEGIIRMQRTNAPTGSSSLRSIETIPFRSTDRYRITIESAVGDRSIFTKVVNLSTGEEAESTFDFVEEWNDLNGDFYWKFGAYMPDGGSTDTLMRMESIEIIGQ